MYFFKWGGGNDRNPRHCQRSHRIQQWMRSESYIQPDLDEEDAKNARVSKGCVYRN